MSENKIPRMISIEQAANDSGLSYDAVRRLCLQKKIIFVKCGRRYLINTDSFIEYLNGVAGND